MDLKTEKRQAEQIVSFWQGVRKLLESGVSTPIFSYSEYLHEFLEYAKIKQNSEEIKQRKVSETHNEQKISLDKYNVQIGKLKAFQFLLQTKATIQT